MVKIFEHEYVSYEELYEAYIECRKNKRTTINSLAFEIDENVELYKLWIELNDKTYQTGKSIVFCVDKPVKREIFAADFRDRIVHHLVIRRLLPYFESEFIDDSYSCRRGKGTLYGVKRLDSKIKEATKNYSNSATIIKCDIKSFFMSIDKNILYSKLESFIKLNYKGDIDYILWLIRLIVFNEPQNNCIRKQSISHWGGLPKSKSLFSCEKFKGLPIGNLTSQIFANFFLNDFDHLILSLVKYYGRYVDDFYLILTDEESNYVLNSVQSMLSGINLQLHPSKLYMQSTSKGVKFIGAVIKPGRIYISNRTKGYMWQTIQHQEPTHHFISSINSYLGQMVHFNTYNLRKKMLAQITTPGVSPSKTYQKLSLIK